uniref:ZBTB7C antisense RNA 2 n=1 Tax=Nomascus leucogenys TaxID=61853 RepID=A0A2I3GSL7_NOMLE
MERTVHCEGTVSWDNLYREYNTTASTFGPKDILVLPLATDSFFVIEKVTSSLWASVSLFLNNKKIPHGAWLLSPCLHSLQVLVVCAQVYLPLPARSLLCICTCPPFVCSLSDIAASLNPAMCHHGMELSFWMMWHDLTLTPFPSHRANLASSSTHGISQNAESGREIEHQG